MYQEAEASYHVLDDYARRQAIGAALRKLATDIETMSNYQPYFMGPAGDVPYMYPVTIRITSRRVTVAPDQTMDRRGRDYWYASAIVAEQGQ